MTDEQLEVAQRNLTSQMERFGYSLPNIDFWHGYIEDLKSSEIADNSIDVVISNCVLNLSPRGQTGRAYRPIKRLYLLKFFGY